MNVPGSNILNRALRLIKAQPVDYYQDLGRINNAIGIESTSYSAPVSILGSVQAVPLSAYQMLGLDFGKNYVTLYTNTPLIGVERDVSGDLFTFGGKTYQCRSTTNWLAMDGWNSVLAVQTDIGLPEISSYVVTPQGFYVVTPDDEYIVTP